MIPKEPLKLLIFKMVISQLNLFLFTLIEMRMSLLRSQSYTSLTLLWENQHLLWKETCKIRKLTSDSKTESKVELKVESAEYLSKKRNHLSKWVLRHKFTTPLPKGSTIIKEKETYMLTSKLSKKLSAKKKLNEGWKKSKGIFNIAIFE